MFKTILSVLFNTTKYSLSSKFNFHSKPIAKMNIFLLIVFVNVERDITCRENFKVQI